MGWGQIIGGGGDGLYTVALDYGVATRDAWVAAIDGWIERMNIEIADAEAKLIAARDRTAAAEDELQALIGLLSSGGGPDGSAATMARIDIATAGYAKALAAQDALRIPRDQRIAERTALVAKKGAVQAAVVQEVRQAWCVDLTEDATGYVATIEVPGEDQALLIAPGGRQPTAADGALAARELMTPWQAFWNAAVLPGWQKWKPTYRKATITWLDADANLANVTLDAAASSAAQLPINQTPQLNGVRIRYMDCDASAFAVGDRVVVEFEGQSWTAPRIIGFVESPKPCRWVMTPNEAGLPSPFVVCNEAVLIDDMLASGVFTAWVNGRGPYPLQQLYSDREEAGYPGTSPRIDFLNLIGIYIHRNTFTGSGDALYENYNLNGNAVSVGGGLYEEDGTETAVNLQFATTAQVASDAAAWDASAYPGGYAALQHGFFSASVGVQGTFYGAPGEQNIVEVICRVDGRKVLHFAYSSPDGYVVQYKGIPAREFPGFPNQFEPLTDYVFVGS